MAQKSSNRFRGLIKKYLDGNLSVTEERVWDGFLQSEGDQAHWNESEMGDKNQVFQQLSSNINSRIHKRRFSIDPRMYAVAASVALLIGVLTLTQFHKKSSLRFTTTTSIDSLLLDDGSKIVLSPHSVLEYPEEFDEEFREVKLIKGNAFFNVSRDPQRPFRVDQDDLLTEVLGTSFNIRITPLTTVVDVKTGVVAVSSDQDQRVVIHKNEKTVFHRPDNRLEEVNKSDLAKWYASDVSLTNITLRELSKFLENRYGYTLAMTDKKLHDQRIIIHIADNDTIQGVLEQLEYITDLNFKIKANEINVYKN